MHFDGIRLRTIGNAIATEPAFIGKKNNGYVTSLRMRHQNVRAANLNTKAAAGTVLRIYLDNRARR